MKIYNEFADWFHLLTHPRDYADEAADYVRLIHGALPAARTLLELGAGGGNNASHMKRHFTCTLTDLSPRMLAVSRSINPDCEHIQGDMRELRLGRQFDAVFVHDAVEYMVSLDDLSRAVQTAYVHTRPGGVALFVPDGTSETFVPFGRSRRPRWPGRPRAALPRMDARPRSWRDVLRGALCLPAAGRSRRSRGARLPPARAVHTAAVAGRDRIRRVRADDAAAR